MGIILKPFAWLLLFFYEFFHSYGLALILFAIVIKMILFPVTLKSKKSMIQTTMISGKMQQLQKQYGKDRERYNLEVQKLYEKEKVNPMGGCLWSLIPMVVLIALYGIIREPLTHFMGLNAEMIAKVAEITGIANEGSFPQIAMAEAMSNPATLEAVKAALGEAGSKVFAMDFQFLGMNMAAIPNWKFWEGGVTWNSLGLFLMVLISTAISYLSMKVSMATNKLSQQSQNAQMDQTNKVMMLMMPLMSLWIGFTLPAGLCVYWIAQYLVTMVQEVICAKMLKKDYEAARVASEERERQEKENEKKRKEEARLERARRAEEEKKGKKKNAQKKDVEPDQEGVNKEDSREGIRAYARGRAYIPGRFGEVTPYTDPNEMIQAQAAAQSKKKGKKAEKKAEEPKAEEMQNEAEDKKEAPVTEAPVETEIPAPVETEEVEVEVEQVEVEASEDDDKEGV